MKTVKRFATIFLMGVLMGCSVGLQEQQPSFVIDQNGGPLHVWIAGENRSLDVFDSFTAATGIPVQVKFGTQEELFQQVLASRGNPQADLFWSNNAIDLSILAGLGVFEPHESPLAATLPSYAYDRDGLWYGMTARTLAIVYHTAASLEDIPTEVEQLSHPAWQGELIVPPATSRLWDRILADVAVFEGETELKRFLEALADASLTFADETTQDIQSVIDGTIPALLTTSELALQAMAEQKHLSEDIRIQPLGSEHTERIDIVTGIGILRGTEHKKAAETFIDFLLKESSQQALAQQLAHETLVRDETTRNEEVLRLHPNEMAQLVPLMERYWQMSFAEAS